MLQNAAVSILVVCVVLLALNVGTTSPAAKKMSAGVNRLNATLAK